MRFLFKLDDNIEVKIRPVTLYDENPEYTTTGIYSGSEAILRIRGICLNSGKKLRKNMRITKLQKKHCNIGRLTILTA